MPKTSSGKNKLSQLRRKVRSIARSRRGKAAKPESADGAAEQDEKVRFSYSTEDQPLVQRAVIQAIEKMGGQRKLKKLYDQQQNERLPGESFFDAAIRVLQLAVTFDRDKLARTPASGPVVFIANHPYGVLDGVTLTWLAMQVRPDTKVLANSVLCQAPEARSNLLPVDFAATKEARQTNVRSRIDAQNWLKQGHAIGIFPGGGVSTSEKPLKGPAIDLPWAPFTAKLIRQSRATVVPVYFVGQNSRLFQLASHMSLTLRLSLVFRETARRIGTKLELRVGKPIPFEELEQIEDRTEFVNELRRRTFALAVSPEGDQPVPERYMRSFMLKSGRKDEKDD